MNSTTAQCRRTEKSLGWVRHDPDPDQEPREQHPVLGSHAELDRKSESNRKKIVTRKTRLNDHQLSTLISAK